MEKENYHLWREEASQNAFTLADIAIHAMYALTTGNFYIEVLTQFRIRLLHVEVLTNFRIKLLDV